MIQQPQQFQGFKPSGMEKIANAMGFQGNIKDFQQFLQENPDRQSEMMRYQDMARKMVAGGYVNKMQEGGTPKKLDNKGNQPVSPKKKNIRDISLDRITDPKVPAGAKVTPFGIPQGDTGQTVPTDSGQVTGTPKGLTTAPVGNLGSVILLPTTLEIEPPSCIFFTYPPATILRATS